jgi:hypothetical protein
MVGRELIPPGSTSAAPATIMRLGRINFVEFPCEERMLGDFCEALHYNHSLQPCCKQSNRFSGDGVTIIKTFFRNTSVLGCPGWQRIALVLPVCILLWLGVLWAITGDFP